jgi:hypothetical protein
MRRSCGRRVRHDEFVEPWPDVDELIFAHRILPALQAIRAQRGCGLREAIDLFQDRYNLLCAACPEEFTVSAEDYGHGVYT